MSTYASAIATLEHDLRDLDDRRGRIIAAIGSLRALERAAAAVMRVRLGSR